VQGTASFTDGEYTLIVRRALSSNDAENIQFEPSRFIPIAFIAWDGWRGEQDTVAAISSWYSIYLEEPLPPITYAWIPTAMIATALLEGVIVWMVRRSVPRRKTRTVKRDG
jgi:hypothetical protein